MSRESLRLQTEAQTQASFHHGYQGWRRRSRRRIQWKLDCQVSPRLTFQVVLILGDGPSAEDVVHCDSPSVLTSTEHVSPLYLNYYTPGWNQPSMCLANFLSWTIKCSLCSFFFFFCCHSVRGFWAGGVELSRIDRLPSTFQSHLGRDKKPLLHLPSSIFLHLPPSLCFFLLLRFKIQAKGGFC